ncbi:regulatory LuxR family protein [Motilibacter peucedani]|uniref:Regulatory LuxR family protein n=1 Tax=Motilibacter peucedani TaxID=598650 RepID=A0A420XPY2_9ACTN|nr:LuxR family transcriptional regulator [Motilibacter peucedani]RKS75305.1 regulatory LuxR family protein [Motilibacter peucedani]
MIASDGSRLVGRDEVVDVLRARLSSSSGAGGSVGLTGEPGAGKSAVQAHLADLARAAGATVLGARGSSSESHLPYAALHQVLSPLLGRAPELPAPQRTALLASFGLADAPEVNPFFTSLAALELLVDAAGAAPVLVCLDDLQWMDRPSVDALAFVARRIADERVLLLSSAHTESTLLGDERTTTWVRLGGLSEADAHELVLRRAPALEPELRARVVELAGGNPLALVELARSAQDPAREWSELELPLTGRLERAYLARADELDAPARAVLDVAALDDGDDLAPVLAAAALVAGQDVGPGAAVPARELALLTVAGTTYAVAHPLVRSALRRAMPAQRRGEVHAALATVLGAHPERAVWHRASSVPGRDEQVASELEQVAGEARRRGAYATAASTLERAAELSPDPQDEAARLISAAELGYQLGRYAQVEQVTARTAGMSLRPRDRSRLAWLAGAFHDGATSEPAEVRHLVELARLATSQDDLDLAMQLLFGAARRVWWRDPGAAVRRDIVGAARDVPLPAGDPRLLAVLGLTESLELSAPVLQALDALPGDAAGRADIAGLLGIAAFCAGDFVRAESFLTVAVSGLRADGRLSLLAEALAIRSWAEINLGIFDAARSADEGARLAEETGQRVWAGTAELAAAFIDAVGGRWRGSSPLLARAEQTALQLPNASSSLLAGAQLVRGVGELAADRPAQAYGELLRVFAPTDPAFQRVQQLWTVGYLAEAAVRSGARPEARATLAAVDELADGSTAGGTRIALEYSRAVLADEATADGLFRDALAGAAQGFPWHHARLQLAHGSWLRRQRRVTESREPLRTARSAFDALGAQPWALRADQELRATGERGWRPTTSERERLSPQEAQIAALAARGLSNREIAQRLFLSHRTVGSHLYRIFPKLGITSRHQLAGVLTGPVPAAQMQSSD